MERNQKSLLKYFFLIQADVFSTAFPKNTELFVVRGKSYLLSYYCLYNVEKKKIKKRVKKIPFLPASWIYWNRPVLRSSEVCSVFEAWFLSAEKQVGYVRSGINVSTLPFLVRYCHRSSWRRTKQFKCSWPQKTLKRRKKRKKRKEREKIKKLHTNIKPFLKAKAPPQNNRNFKQLWL